MKGLKATGHPLRPVLMAAVVVAVALVPAATPVRADRDRHGESDRPRDHHDRRPRTDAVTDPLVRQECGECHLAFPAHLLPAGSWARIMDTLDDHFGDRASLPPDQVAAIKAWLTSHAGRGDAAVLRITEQSWFQREHRLEAARWTAPGVRSKSNCAACHPGAAAGRFEDDD